MEEQTVKALLMFIGAGIKVLSARIVLLITLSMTFGMFCWAMYLPGEQRIVIATLFAVLVFLPSVAIDRKQVANRATVEGS